MSEPTIVRRRPVGMITVRCDFDAPRLEPALLDAFGCGRPERRRIRFAGDCGLAWMSPDELLAFVPVESAEGRCAAFAESLGPVHHLAVVVSDARAVFRIEGPGVRDALAKGAPVDLAPDAFGAGDFRRTRLGQVAAALWTPDGAAFEVMCFRSVADFVGDWLRAAAAPAASSGYFRAS